MVIDTSKPGFWKTIIGGSWKTSLAGYVFLAAGAVWTNPGDFVKWPMLVMIAKYVTILSGGAGLRMAKDFNVTGGTVPNPLNDPKAVAATTVAKP